MASDDAVVGGWQTFIPSRNGAQLIRRKLETVVKEDWPRPQKFSGPLTRIRALKSKASATWNVNAGEVVELPMELADMLCRKGTARLARPDEPLSYGAIE